MGDMCPKLSVRLRVTPMDQRTWRGGTGIILELRHGALTI